MNKPAMITTNADEIRYYVGEIKATMHPGDYADTLAIIVYHARKEAERLCRELGTSAPLETLLRELVGEAAWHARGNDTLN